MTEAATSQAPNPVCDGVACGTKGLQALYVHLHTGEIATVTGVTRVEVTDTVIVFRRGNEAPVSFPRNAVYFTCCDKDQAPPQF